MPTPQELMDMPFAGQAEKELCKHGMWDEKKLLDDYYDGVEREYVVVVSGYYEPTPELQKITVIATSPGEAQDKAEDKSDFDEIEDAEIERVKEITQ